MLIIKERELVSDGRHWNNRNPEFQVLLNVAMNCPHPQPFSPGRRELRFLFPLLWERARVRAAKDSNPKIILLFSNAEFQQPVGRR
jgi:hypothetical protein